MTAEEGIRRRKVWDFLSFCSVSEFVCVCASVCVQVSMVIRRCSRVSTFSCIPVLSPPDVGGLWVFLLGSHPGLWTLATCSLAATARVGSESRLTVLLLVSLPWRTRVLLLGEGRHVAVVVLHSGPRGRRGEGGAEAQAVTQGPPVLLAL